jgi:Na+-driven multidrug efflux pump
VYYFHFDDLSLNILNTPNEILYDSRVFLLLVAVSFTPNFLQKNINESLRILNKPNIPLIFVGINVMLNNLLLYLLILNNYGTISIAIANILSDIFILLASYIYIRSHEVLKIDFSLFKLDRNIFKDISNIGMPIVFEQIIVAFIIFIETSISNLGGIICNSAFGIVGRWEEIFFVFSQSIQSLMIIYISRYYFTKDKTMIFRITKNGIILPILPILLFISIAFIFTDFACKIFLKDEKVILTAVKYFHIAGIAYCIMPIDMIFNGFIIGSAKTKFLLITNIIASIFEVIIFILLYKILNYDNMLALGCGIVTYTLFTLLLNFIYYLKNVFTLCKIEK